MIPDRQEKERSRFIHGVAFDLKEAETAPLLYISFKELNIPMVRRSQSGDYDILENQTWRAL